MQQMDIKKFIQTEELVKLTMSLVEIPSYPGIPNQEANIACFIKKFFDGEDIDCCIKELSGGRYNVIARLPGKGGGKTLLLNGHMDTVKPFGMKDATSPRLLENRISGRGTSDMKGALASMMLAMSAIKRSGTRLCGDLIFSGVADEEGASTGTIDLVESALKVDGAIVGEPTELQLATAHMGLEWFEFKIKGRTVHGGGYKSGINAILKAVEFIEKGEKEIFSKISEKQHPILGTGTLNFGLINGGTQLSTVPGECTVGVDRRYLPDQNYFEIKREFEDLIKELAGRDADFNCTMEVMEESKMKAGYVHAPLEISREHSFVKTIERAYKKQFGDELVCTYFPAWTDGGILSCYGKIPTVVFGPGSLACCHSEEEYIETDQLYKACLSYASIAMEFCAEKG